MHSRPVCVALMVLLACAAGGAVRADDFSDRQIERDARRSYVLATLLKGSVQVTAQNGVATLSGRVETPDQRMMADNAVDLIPNVDCLDDQIRVGGPAEERSDAWIALHLKASLLLHRNVSATATRILVHDGEVFLQGSAYTTAQKELTQSYAYQIAGVSSVLDEIQVRPPPAPTFVGDSSYAATRNWDDPSITAQVRYELLRRHLSVGPKLHVRTRSGVVTITGVAENQDEKELIGHTAETAPGVREVVNLMAVRNQ